MTCGHWKHTRAIVEGSSASAKSTVLGSSKRYNKTEYSGKAPNGAIVQGDANDVTTLQVQKYNDFRVAQETAQRITERLSFTTAQ